VKFAAVGRESERLPKWVLTIALDGGDGLGRRERFDEDGGIAQEQIEFAENELAERDILPCR